jgi:integrase
MENGKAYTIFYRDVRLPDGTSDTERARYCHGDLISMSEREARRQHDVLMADVNRQRGCVPPPVRGQTFLDAVNAWRSAVAPQLSPGTARQRESYLRNHILPKLGGSASHSLDVQALQQFATDLPKEVSPRTKRALSAKTIVNILGAIFGVLRYARKCRMRTADVAFRDLTLRTPETPDRPFFTSEEVRRIIAAATEPFKTIFALAALLGARAGELLALTVSDLDFRRRTIRVNKSSDDNTREIREPKTKKSIALLPMPSSLETMLREYLSHHWIDNPKQLLFPAPRKRGLARSRDNVVKCGLKPILRKLGMPVKGVGLHAFRHGLATELAESEPITVLQAQMRHADVRTTLKVYAHVIPQSQRDSMERIAHRSLRNLDASGHPEHKHKPRINAGENTSIGTNVPFGTGSSAQAVHSQ